MTGRVRVRNRTVRRSSAALLLAGAASCALAVPAGAIDLPLPPLPLPLPTTTTTLPPTTTTTGPPTTTTTAAPTTTTTRAPTTTTSRPRPTSTTTTPRRTPTTTGAAGPGAPVSSVTNGRATPSTSRSVIRNRRRLPIAGGPVAGAWPPGSASSPGGPEPAPDAPSRDRGADRTVAVGRTAALSSGMSDVFDAMPGPLLLAGGLVALLLVAAALARVRAHDPYLRASRLGAGTLVVERDDAEADVADRLLVTVPAGPVRVVGRDCRGLQLLVKVAAQQGLEVVDPEGFLVRATRRLVTAKDLLADRRRLPLSWSVTVERPTVTVIEGWNLRSTGTADGRVLSFAPGSSLLLWDGDVLR